MRPNCSIKDCDKPVNTYKSGYCLSHEKRWRRHGDPLAGRAYRMTPPDSCLIDGCGGNPESRGYCSKHYNRLLRHGDPNGGGTPKGALREFVESAIGSHQDDCLNWPFPGSVSRGYGHLFIDGRTVKAHRYVCKKVHGPPPSRRHQAAHKCGVRSCINPRHLYWATALENTTDKYSHGTMLVGEKAPWAKLTEDDVRAIRKRCETELQREVAESFGISKSMVGMIVRRKRWAHVD